MVASQARIPTTRYVVALLLTLAMVFAHWQGLAHRIAHATQYSSAALDSAVNGSAASHQKTVPHSCIAFDAATVAPALDTPACTTAILPAARVLAQWTAFDSWNAPFTSYFSSRAPPVA
jgi:hypothetical protein